MGCSHSEEIKERQAQAYFAKNYRLDNKLGEGAFAQVRAATGPRGKCAVKIIRRMDNESVKTAVAEEDAVWRKVGQCAYVVEHFDTFVGRGLCFLVMERCKSSVLARLEEMTTAQEADIARIFREMLLGIEHVHSRNVVHRDVKPDNFLFGGMGGNTVKLCDFGLARVPPKKGLMKEIAGTAPYMSPEMLKGVGYDHRTDIWSFAATAYVMVFGEFPYRPPENTGKMMKKAILEGEPPPDYARPLEVEGNPPSDNAADFVRTLLNRDGKERLTASQALDLPMLSQPLFSLENSKSLATMRTVVRMARKRSKDFRMAPDPTVQRGIDDLVKDLNSGGLARAFSLPMDNKPRPSESTNASSMAGSRAPTKDFDMLSWSSSARTSRKCSTHSGVLSVQLKAAAMRSIDGDDEDSPPAPLTSQGSPRLTPLTSPRSPATPKCLKKVKLEPGVAATYYYSFDGGPASPLPVVPPVCSSPLSFPRSPQTGAVTQKKTDDTDNASMSTFVAEDGTSWATTESATSESDTREELPLVPPCKNATVSQMRLFAPKLVLASERNALV